MKCPYQKILVWYGIKLLISRQVLNIQLSIVTFLWIHANNKPIFVAQVFYIHHLWWYHDKYQIHTKMSNYNYNYGEKLSTCFTYRCLHLKAHQLALSLYTAILKGISILAILKVVSCYGMISELGVVVNVQMLARQTADKTWVATVQTSYVYIV